MISRHLKVFFLNFFKARLELHYVKLRFPALSDESNIEDNFKKIFLVFSFQLFSSKETKEKCSWKNISGTLFSFSYRK